jgi:hypothetical protein
MLGKERVPLMTLPENKPAVCMTWKVSQGLKNWHNMLYSFMANHMRLVRAAYDLFIICAKVVEKFVLDPLTPPPLTTPTPQQVPPDRPSNCTVHHCVNIITNMLGGY